MNPLLRYRIAVVDGDRDFVSLVSGELERRLQRSDWFVPAYTSADQLLQDVEKTDPLVVPVCLVADTAARSPSVENGVFALTKKLVPRCRTVYYSSTMDKQKELEHSLLVDRSIWRGERDAIAVLANVLRHEIAEFERSVEFKLLTAFSASVAADPEPEMSSGSEGGKNLSPMKMLIEMARRTEDGLMYLHRLC